MTQTIEVELLKALNAGLLTKEEYKAQLAKVQSGNGTTNAKESEWEGLLELPLDEPRGNTLAVVRATKQTKPDGTVTYGMTLATKNIGGKGNDFKRFFVPQERLESLQHNIGIVLKAIEKDQQSSS